MATRQSASSEAGFTLIELLVAMVVTAIAVIGILGALGTSIMSSAVQQNHATGEATMRSLAEHVKTVRFVPCAGTDTYITDDAEFEAEVGFRVVDVLYWDGNDESPLTFVDTCPGVTGDGLQLVTIEVEKPDRSPALRLSVVKRDNR